jgi:hypothetical protein
VPSATRQRELHEADDPDDQYEADAGAETGEPVITGARA